MIRVLHVTESIHAAAGGTSAAFVGLIEALRTQGGRLEVRAVTQRPEPGDGVLEWINPADPMWVWTGRPGRLWAGSLGRAAAETIRAFRPHVVHLHGLWCADLVHAAKAARSTRAAAVWQPHGMLVREALRRSWRKKQVFLALGLSRELAAARGAVFTSSTEESTSAVERLGPRVRRAVVPLMVRIEPEEADLPRLHREGRAKWSIPADAPTAVFVGRLHPVKRVELTLAAFARARREHPAARLLLVGEGEGAYVAGLRGLADRLGIGPAVTWAGWLHGEDKFRALAAADALVFNSEFENFGFAAVEALNCHTPTVMTDNLSLARPSAEAGAGVVAPGEAEGLGDALAGMLVNPERRAMGRRGRAWVVRTFSAPVIGASLANFYAAVAGLDAAGHTGANR